MDSLSSESADLIHNNISQLRKLFPETILDDGKVDFDALRILLEKDSAVSTDMERYSLQWHGKNNAMKLALKSTSATLLPKISKSENWNKTNNLYFEGDNLEVLKVIQKSYAGQIKSIYMDPPYNTGKDFIYPDDYSDDLNNYLVLTGQVADDNTKYSTNTDVDGRFHTKWLNMMYPRLKLARNLLTDNGAIFVSIDDNEVDNLRKIMDEIFGEKNFLAMITVIVRPEGRHYGAFSKTHDFLLVYAKNADEVELNDIQVAGSEFKYTDEFGGFNLRDLRNQAPRLFNSRNRPNLRFPLWVNEGELNDNGFMPVSTVELDGWTEVWPIVVNGNESVYQWGRDKIANEINDVTARKGTDGVIRIYQKRRKTTQKAKTLWTGAEFISNRGTKETQALFDGKTYFDFPKPVELIKRIAEISTSEDDIMLDAFSGSGTTADAVMRLAATDEKHRTYMLIQYPELIDADSPAGKDGYRTIPHLAEERIRRSAEKLKDEGFAMFDDGFKVFELAPSNIKSWNGISADGQGVLDFSSNNLVEGRVDEDLLYEILLKKGLSLNLNVDVIHEDGVTIFDVADGMLFIITGTNITREAAEIVAKKRNEYDSEGLIITSNVVLLDAGFVTTEEKLNAMSILENSGYDNSEIESI